MASRTRSRRRRRPVLITLVSIVTLAVLFAVACIPLYVFPRTDPETKTDVVMVIGPPNPTRIRIAESMIRRGLSDQLVVSAPAEGFQSIGMQRVCTEPQTFHVTCFTPDPFTTQGEARELRKLAAAHHWTSATVITYPPHIVRARIIMRRCFSGELHMTADRTPLRPGFWLYSFAYQTGAFVKVALHERC